MYGLRDKFETVKQFDKATQNGTILNRYLPSGIFTGVRAIKAINPPP